MINRELKLRHVFIQERKTVASSAIIHVLEAQRVKICNATLYVRKDFCFSPEVGVPEATVAGAWRLLGFGEVMSGCHGSGG